MNTHAIGFKKVKVSEVDIINLNGCGGEDVMLAVLVVANVKYDELIAATRYQGVENVNIVELDIISNHWPVIPNGKFGIVMNCLDMFFACGNGSLQDMDLSNEYSYVLDFLRAE